MTWPATLELPHWKEQFAYLSASKRVAVWLILHCFLVQDCGGLGTIPVSFGARGGIHPRSFVSQSQGHIETKETDNFIQNYLYLCLQVFYITFLSIITYTLFRFGTLWKNMTLAVQQVEAVTT